ncbi:MAG: DUF6531 domain-containing protein, partial [Planctomycetota bacterium]
MKRLVVIAVLWASCAGLCSAGNCNIPGWVIDPNQVRYVASLSSGGQWAHYLCLYVHDESDWCQWRLHWDESEQKYVVDCSPGDPYWHSTPSGYQKWDGDLDLLYTNCDNPQPVLNEAYLAKAMIDSGLILSYLNEQYPNGGADPNFEENFLMEFEMDNPESECAGDPLLHPAGSTEGGDPVFMSNGEYRLSVTDLSIQGRGLPVEIVRTYGSRREYNSRFGYGWDMNYNMKVRRLVPIAGEPNTVVLLDGGGYRREYAQDDTDPNLYERDEDLTDHLDFNDVDNTFTLVKKSGTEYLFDPNGNLSSISDRNGNIITFTYDSSGPMLINGPSYFFHDQPSGKYGLVAREYQLKTITDDLGRTV